MSCDVSSDLRAVLADLRRDAPGLHHIHAGIEAVLAKLDDRPCGFDNGGDLPAGRRAILAWANPYLPTTEAARYSYSEDDIADHRPYNPYNPEFAAGVALPSNAKRLLEDEDDDEVEPEAADEDESGDAEDAA